MLELSKDLENSDTTRLYEKYQDIAELYRMRLFDQEQFQEMRKRWLKRR